MIDNQELVHKYKQSWVMMHSKQDTSVWSPDQINACYALLVPPAIGIEEWMIRVGVDPEARMKDNNAAAVSAIQAAGDEHITIERSE